MATHVITLHHVIDLFSKNKTVQCVFYSYHIHLPWGVGVIKVLANQYANDISKQSISLLATTNIYITDLEGLLVN